LAASILAGFFGSAYMDFLIRSEMSVLRFPENLKVRFVQNGGGYKILGV